MGLNPIDFTGVIVTILSYKNYENGSQFQGRPSGTLLVADWPGIITHDRPDGTERLPAGSLEAPRGFR